MRPLNIRDPPPTGGFGGSFHQFWLLLLTHFAFFTHHVVDETSYLHQSNMRTPLQELEKLKCSKTLE